MEKKIILPTINNPPIITYNHHAAYLGILFTLKDFYKYFYSDYINLWFDDLNEVYPYNFLTEYWYDDEILFDVFLLVNNNGIDFLHHFKEIDEEENSLQIPSNNLLESIKTMISNGFYISGNINEFYVPNRFSTGKIYNSHDYYIFGFNDYADSFYLNGYTLNDKFETIQIKYSDYIYGNITLREKSKLQFTKLKNQYQFEINIKKITSLIEDYLSARGGVFALKRHFPQNSKSPYFGLGIYDRLDYLCKNNWRSKLDLRIFLMLKEHKQCMLNRIKMLEEVNENINDTIYYEYKHIFDVHSGMFNMAIKYNQTKSKSTLDEIEKMLLDVKNKEANILASMYKLLV